MALRPQERERGLVALNEARQQRRRAVSLGRVRVRDVATGFWVATFVGLTLFSFAYYRYTLVALDAQRSELLGQKNALAELVGPGGFELRDRVESWVIALASGQVPDVIAPELDLDDLAKGPSLYLRLRQSEAHSAESIRKAAKGSLRDGFTSCLFEGAAPDRSRAKTCGMTAQCDAGEVCSDWNVCAPPTHPYTMRLLYEGLRALTPEWEQALEAATDEMQVRVMELDLQSVTKHEAVAAVELVRRSKYFTLVLDEEAAPGSQSVTPPVAGESPDEQLQAVQHGVRVGIWDIERAAPLAVLRVEAGARFVRLGSGPEADVKTMRAQQRQANNCAVATQVREAVRTLPSKQQPGVVGAPLVAE